MSTAIDISDRLVTIRSRLSMAEAEILKSLLDANGVPCFLTAGHMAGLNYAVTTDLQVRIIDKVRADHVLDRIAAIPVKPAGPVPGDDVSCPTCGSARLAPVVGKIGTAIPFVRLYAGPEDRWYDCTLCGARFKDVRTRFSSVGVALGWGVTLGLATLGVIWLIGWVRF